MNEQTITCPKCKTEIPLTEAISHKIRGKLAAEFEAQARKKEEGFEQREKALTDREKEIETSKRSLDEQVAGKVKLEVDKIEKEAKQKAEDELAVQLKNFQRQNDEYQEKLQAAQNTELELRKICRELEEKGKNVDLEVARKLDEERKKISDEAVKNAEEEYKFKDLEKEKIISDMRGQIEILKRKAEQGSQQAQGEVLELELEDILKASFPVDVIEPVPKGIRGADVLQKVHDQAGRHCGTIVWEAKRTKAWNDNWIEKVKDDQRAVKAEIAVLITAILPKEIGNFGCIRGVWVTDFQSAIGLATALRINLLQLSAARQSVVGKNEKMEALYGYLSGLEFNQKVEAIVESFMSMKEELEKEKRAFAKIWAKREKQIERIVGNTAGMYGDIQGIIGASLPEITNLELKALTDGSGNG